MIINTSTIQNTLAEQAADDASAPTLDTLERIINMGESLVDAQFEHDRLSEKLKDAKKKLLKIEREDLPNLMSEAGIDFFGLRDGRKIEIESDCTCAITKANEHAALAWLTNNDFGGLIKTQVTAGFGRGEREAAQSLADGIAENHDDVTVKESVHHSTLKSFVKEQLEAAAPLPMDLFSVVTFSKAVVSK